MNLLITALVALFATFIASPLARRLAFKIGAVQIPKDDRGKKKSPIALLGGLAMIAGFFAAFLYNILGKTVTADEQIAGMFAGVAVLVICGLADDLFAVNWKIKMAFQIAAAVLFIAISGDRIEFLTNPLAPHLVVMLPPLVSWPLTVLWIIGITNAVNFIDGLDGLAAGVSCISALSLLFVSITAPELTSGTAAPLMLAAIAGSTLGFLPFNFNPARMFMGETGAAFLGFCLAAVSLQGLLKSYAAISLAIPVLIIGLPIFNGLFASIRRIRRRSSLATGDKSHLHDKLIEMGLTHKQSVLVLYVASAVLGLVGVVFANKNYLSAVALLALLPVFIFVLLRFLINGDDPNIEASATDSQASATDSQASVTDDDSQANLTGHSQASDSTDTPDAPDADHSPPNN